MSEYSTFTQSRRLQYESQLLNERLEREYLRQKIDNQIKNRLLNSPERDRELYRSPVRDNNIRYLSPNSIKERLLSNNNIHNNSSNISNIQKTNQHLSDSIKRLNAYQKGSSIYQSPSKLSSTYVNSEYIRNHESSHQFEQERRLREQRKKEIMSKINELNYKLNSEQSQFSNISRYSAQPSNSQNNFGSSGNYTSPPSKQVDSGLASSSLYSQQHQQTYYLSQQNQNSKKDSVVDKTSPILENKLSQSNQPASEFPTGSPSAITNGPVEQTIPKAQLKSETSPKSDFNSSSTANELRLKQEIQRLENANIVLKQQIEKQEQQFNETTQRLKEQLQQNSNDNLKMKDSTKNDNDQYKIAYENEKKKNEVLLIQCAQFEQNLNQQNEEMSESLKGIKQNYEEKLQQFEQLLQESNVKIQGIQAQYSEEPLIKAIKENPQILELIYEKLNGEEKSDSQQSNRTAGLEKLLERKEEIIREQGLQDFQNFNYISTQVFNIKIVSRNNELKDLEIKKMEELIEKFKALFSHINEEKEILTAENERLNDENDQCKLYISKIMSYNLVDKKENGEEAENDHQEDDGDYEQQEGEDNENVDQDEQEQNYEKHNEEDDQANE